MTGERDIVCQPLTASAFAPFGDVLEATGTPDKLMEEDIVRETYLGEGKGRYLKRRAIWRGF